MNVFYDITKGPFTNTLGERTRFLVKWVCIAPNLYINYRCICGTKLKRHSVTSCDNHCANIFFFTHLDLFCATKGEFLPKDGVTADTVPSAGCWKLM